VRPGQSIQQAIEQAAAGAVICLSAGTFQENIEIKKSLTLRGTGRERTIIKSKEDGEPVFDLALIDIQTEDEITVVLGRLTVTGAKGASGVVGVRVGGKANVTVSDSQVFDNVYGLLVWMGSATVSLTDSQVSGNGFVGLSVCILVSLVPNCFPQVTLQNVTVSGNGGFGLVVGQGRVTLQDSQVSGNSTSGLLMGSQAQVSLQGSEVSDNGSFGLKVFGSQVSLTNSTVSGNGLDGLSVGDEAQVTAQVTVEDSFIEGNGTDPNCNRPGDFICNGIEVSGEAHMELRGTTIRNNTGWGVAAFLKQCGYNEDLFAGTVTFEGENTIESNNTSGNHNGKGNPGNHPFKNLPDGQVCLP
jgi:hypothetical protein